MDNLDEIYALRRSSENVDMKQPTYINSTNLNKSYTIIDDSSEGNYEEGDYGWENDRMESKYCQVTRVREGLQQGGCGRVDDREGGLKEKMISVKQYFGKE